MTIKPYTRTQIQCLETGLTFDGVTVLANTIGLSKSAVVNHLNRPEKFPHLRGWHFKRIAVPSHEQEGEK